MSFSLTKVHNCLAKRKRARLAELAEELFVCISRSKSPRFHDLLLQACLNGGLTPNVVQEVESEATLISLVAIGMAAAFVVSSTARPWHPDVALIPVTDLDVTLDLHLAWNADGRSHYVSNFIDVLRRRDDIVDRKGA